MAADLAALARFHDGLEEGAEDGGGDARPIEAGANEQGVAHVPVEVGEVEALGEEGAVDVAEAGEILVEVPLALLLGRVEDAEEAVEVHAEVGAVGRGLVFEVKAEGVALEDAGVLGEEAEEDADEEALQIVTAVAAGFDGVVQVAHDGDGFEVDRVLVLELVLFVAGDERESVDVPVELSQGELDGGDAELVEEREVALVVGLQIVDGDAGEVGEDDVAGDFLLATLADEIADVAEGLGLRLAEVATEALVFDQQDAGPEEVDEAAVAGDLLDRLLKAGHELATQAEDLEELVPEGLLVGGLPRGARPFAGEADGVLADFVPTDGHGRGKADESPKGKNLLDGRSTAP